MKLNYIINRDLAVIIKNSTAAVIRSKVKTNILDFAISRIFLFLWRYNRQKSRES